MTIVPHIPKSSRYTIGSRIENKFLDLLELSYRAYFTPTPKLNNQQRNNTDAYLNKTDCSGKNLNSDFGTGQAEKEKKLEYITRCILVLDTLKFLLHVSWEGKLVSHAHYGTLGEKLDEVGKMFGGWKKGLEQKTPTK